MIGSKRVALRKVNFLKYINNVQSNSCEKYNFNGEPTPKGFGGDDPTEEEIAGRNPNETGVE